MLELPILLQDTLHRLIPRRLQVLRELRLATERGDAVHNLHARAPEPAEHLLEVHFAGLEDHVLLPKGHGDGEHLLTAVHPRKELHRGVDGHLGEARLASRSHPTDIITSSQLILKALS